MDVLPEPLCPQPSPYLARPFACQQNIAKLPHRCQTRFFRQHAGLDVLLNLEVDVGLDFVFQHFAAFFRPGHAGTLSALPPSYLLSSVSGVRTHPIASENRCHREVSAKSFLWPFL